mmetsp:Transcript_5067/g.10687  ORF Transcript_5067/g.10687 Transcript_5067/m.10687 type:complete len:113 (+) Transcript_5067:761-1099(+)|eukprot:CAMPEP_0194341946 /NCGR_PEP_ID=MMETSP0171-20130528/91322_1 /TAXON_ID=218684 /ORGANISM="Corethron pennatum, Strain L29A3" /LENGTH=112 /DNA_ID=CAMNT_0039107475 /DNA_START=713 /DNA_END=1051 /DNA_ORIENTATION=+
MIGVADIEGFIPKACHIHPRVKGKFSSISGAGSAGTVTVDLFLKFIQIKVCPFLGDLSLGEIRSVVMMGVKDAIADKGAYLLYGAPYSPDLNPIKKVFSVYKAYLKRFDGED